MQLESSDEALKEIIDGHVSLESRNWLEDKINLLLHQQSAKDLYLTYSLIPSKVGMVENLTVNNTATNLHNYLSDQKANIQQVTRIYLLTKVLNSDNEFFAPKVAKLIEVADTGELETFLKYLSILPKSEYFKATAVDALRTNISTVFNSLAYYNPYPSQYFDDKQWNQMFLKTAFMQGDLSAILDVDKRANKDLARIISDYAHERWAAGRDIDPHFWRPVSKFIGEELLQDMKRLLNSDNFIENRAGALCCYYSDNEAAKKLLDEHQSLVRQIENNQLNWETINEK